MTGMQTLIAVRQQGVKPQAVFVDIVHKISKYEAEKYSYAENSGIVSVHIEDADKIGDIDFRPFIGLKSVFVSEFIGNPKRHKQVCRAIADAGAKHMVTPFWNGEDLNVYQFHAKEAGVSA